MMEGIREEAVGFLFNVEVQVQQPVVPVLTPDAGALATVREALGTTAEVADTDAQTPEPEAPAAPVVEPVLPRGFGPQREAALQYSAPTLDGEGEIVRTSGPETDGDTARNAPCPCGSGKKYKRCHGAPGSD